MKPAGPNTINTKTAALYLHIPFCVKRCNYCDFFTVAQQEKLIPDYLRAVLREVKSYAVVEPWRDEIFSTIYFGGGTPSLLSPPQVGEILTALRQSFQFSQQPEVTFEVNPGTVTSGKLPAYAAAGINRISIGVQSFWPHELQQLDRLHTLREIEATVAAVRRSGIGNLSIDLMFALTGQKPSRWRHSLERAVTLKPQHISAYSLTIENGTPLHKMVQAGKAKPVSELRQRIFYNFTIEFLEENGYEHYEVSNYALPGFESRHNSKYWDGSRYLGLGAAAHSFDGRRRFSNVRSIPQYIDRLDNGKLPVFSEELLTTAVRQFEMIFLALRHSCGLDVNEFEARFGLRFQEKFQPQIDKLLAHQPPLIKFEDSRMRLTREGWLMCDSVCAEFA